MKPFRTLNRGTWLLGMVAVLLLTLVGCEKGTLGVHGGSVSGLVRDSRTLAGIPSVNVTAKSGTSADDNTSIYAVTDSNGAYSMNDMRPGEWSFSFDRTGYTRIEDTASAAPKVVVVNDEHRLVPEVRMTSTYLNQYITVKGQLKDAITGTPITLGNANFIFGNSSFMNRQPTEFTTGFSIPADLGDINYTINVTNYQSVSGTISGTTDQDVGIILLQPQAYKIVVNWKDVPGWVQTANAPVRVFAYAGNRLISSVDGTLGDVSVTLEGIPIGQEISITAEVRGYRMTSPVLVSPNGDFQGTVYQSISLRSNFSMIMRNVTVVLVSTSFSIGHRVGAYCEETGTRWPETVVVNPPGALGTSRLVELGTLSMPTGYPFVFRGYNADTGGETQSTFTINDDGSSPQIVTLRVP